MAGRRTNWVRAALAAAVMAFGVGAHDATAQQSPLVGFWECTGENNGVSYFSTFDYQANGRYVSTQRIVAGNNLLEGGGGGSWRLENGILHDTKERATLDRYVRNGAEVPSSDAEWQQLYRQSQSNIGVTSSGPIEIQGDLARSGMYTCHRRRR